MDQSEDEHGDWSFGLNHVARGYNIAICPGTYYHHYTNPNGMYHGMDHKKQQDLYKKLLMNHIEKFRTSSQNYIRKESNGHELISGGKLYVEDKYRSH